MKKIITYTVTLLFMTHLSSAQFEPNYDEAKVPVFSIPDLMTTFSGEAIKNSEEWNTKRRPELFNFFEENVYGKVPGTLDHTSFKIVEQNEDALNGKAHRKQIEVTLQNGDRSLNFNILLYLPKSKDKAPLFLGYNFFGNHTITTDPNVLVSQAWTMNNTELGITGNQATETSRGVRTNRWAIDKILDKGFGLAVIYYGEVDPDKNDFSDGLHALFYKEGQKQPKADEWGSIAAWAFGLSRALDFLEKDDQIDASKVIAFGHSRLGKAALWAGVTDQRFAGVISNNSGCGGAALSKRKFGETVGRINASFPHWFCDNFEKYNENEEALLIDQHQLLALIAPRPLYVASAEEDQWADPRGEFLSAHYTFPVYGLFGKEGITSQRMPEVNQPVQNTVAYHIRTGVHDVTDYDWEQYLTWAKKFIE